MEPVRYDYSVKDIPLVPRDEYKLKLLHQTLLFISRIRWRAFFFLNPELTPPPRETYGFKSGKAGPVIHSLKSFEYKLLNLIQQVQFTDHKTPFQRKLMQDIKEIRNDTRLIIEADKSSTYYKMDKQAYSNLLHTNVTKDYKKADNQAKKLLIAKDLEIANKLDLADRIEVPADRCARVTIKDHKDNFPNTVSCRLLNPFKSEIGRISKIILDRINQNIRNGAGINQWQSTGAVQDWFNRLPPNTKHTFITFDVVDFYPSITKKLLLDALRFASTYDSEISDSEIDIIMHTKNNLLYHENVPWRKRDNEDNFDVPMGSMDGAETCELVGAFLLSFLKPLFHDRVGLYRDDGLAVSDKTPRLTEKLAQQISSIFKTHKLKITITANQKVTNFLDVTLDLNQKSYRPYQKPNNTLSYVHTHSNHPPGILKNIPISINNRLSRISSSEELFKQASPTYQAALLKSGYTHTLKYSNSPQQNTSRRNRSRNITWFNPPYCRSVRTNIGHKFLQLIDQCFRANHPLKKIMNRNTVKISYSCLPNVQRIIHAHNSKLLNQDHNTQQSSRNCSCTNRPCPLSGNCLTKSVVYRAVVTREDNNTQESYVGITKNTFKSRYDQHTHTFRNPDPNHSTELSRHVNALTANNIQHKIEWSILRRCASYSNVTKVCRLCLYEKFVILCKPELCSLNKRSELTQGCMHMRNYKLKHYKKT